MSHLREFSSICGPERLSRPFLTHFSPQNASRSPPEPFFDRIYGIFQDFRPFQPFAAVSPHRSQIYRSHLETASRFRPPLKIIDFRLHLRIFASICGPTRPQNRIFTDFRPSKPSARSIFVILSLIFDFCLIILQIFKSSRAFHG